MQCRRNGPEEQMCVRAYHGIGDLGRARLERRVLGQVDGEEARVRHGQHVVRPLSVLHVQTRLGYENSREHGEK